MTARIYRVLEVFTDLVYLNLLWLVACLPVVTIAPSNTAMFGVVRGWIGGKDTPTTREFYSHFRELWPIPRGGSRLGDARVGATSWIGRE